MKRFALDCEMVGGFTGRNILARVSIVDERGSCVYDEYVKPQESVYDYRTALSGITANHLVNAKSFSQIVKVPKPMCRGPLDNLMKCMRVHKANAVPAHAIGRKQRQHPPGVQDDVIRIVNSGILVGHSVDVDLSALGLTHPQHLIRDVATYPRFMQHNAGMKPSLQVLADRELGLSIQRGPHSSVEDAKAAMMLYNKVAHAWQ